MQRMTVACSQKIAVDGVPMLLMKLLHAVPKESIWDLIVDDTAQKLATSLLLLLLLLLLVGSGPVWDCNIAAASFSKERQSLNPE
jgi:hypothetical protein